MKKKLKIGFFSFTCCEGCVVSFLEILNEKFFEWRDKIDILYLRALKKVKPIRAMDVAFVEGAISTESEIRKLKKIRENAKKLIAIGSGAINGWPSNMRNDFKGAKKKFADELVKKMGQNEKILPLKSFVKVDNEVVGCPINSDIFIQKMSELIEGRVEMEGGRQV